MFARKVYASNEESQFLPQEDNQLSDSPWILTDLPGSRLDVIDRGSGFNYRTRFVLEAKSSVIRAKIVTANIQPNAMLCSQRAEVMRRSFIPPSMKINSYRSLFLFCCLQACLFFGLLRGNAPAQTVTMGSLSFNISVQNGAVVGLVNFQWQGTAITPASDLMSLSLVINGSTWTSFDLIAASSGSSSATVRLKPAGLTGPEIKYVFQPFNQTIGAHVFNGFTYRYEVVSSAPGCEIVEQTRWCLTGNPASGTYFIRNVYGPQEYQLGGPSALNTWSGGTLPHSRFGKMQAYDYHYIPSRGVMLIYFDQPGLIINGKKSYTIGGVPQDRDQYFVAQPAMATQWKRVLVHANSSVLTAEQQRQDFAEISVWADNYYRQLKGFSTPDPKPFLWVGPRFARVQSMLPDIYDLGFKRIYVGPIWKSSATEGGGRTTMSVYDWDVAATWGGIAGLTSLCTEAHKYGIEVIAWFSFVHLSDQAPLLASNPGWRGYPVRDDLYNGMLIPLDLSQPAVRDHVMQKLQAVKNAGLDGLWLDSYHNFAIEVYHPNGTARLPQVEEVLSLQKQIQDLGLVTYVEGMTPYGISSAAIDDGRLTNSYGTKEWRVLHAGFHLEKEALNTAGNAIGSDLTGVDYLKFLAWHGPLGLNTLVSDTNPLWANFSTTDLTMLRRTNMYYNSVVDTMKSAPEVFASNAGIRWNGTNAWSIFAFQDASVSSASGHVAVDLNDLSYLTTGSSLAIRKDHVYKQVSTMPIFNDSFESGDFVHPQGTGASWTLSGTPAVQGTVALDRTRSALMNDTQSDAGLSMVASFNRVPVGGVCSINFTASVQHIGTNDNNNWLVLRNGLSDIRVRIRWRQGSLQYGAAWTNFGTYASGEVLDYTIVLNEAAATYSIYVSNGASIVDVPVEGTASNGINRAAFSSGVMNSSQVLFYLDNVNVSATGAVLSDKFESGNFTSPQGPGASWSVTGATTTNASVLQGLYSAKMLDNSGASNQSLTGVFPKTSGAGLYRLSFNARVNHIGTQSNNNHVAMRNGSGDFRIRLRWQQGNLQVGSNWTSFGTYAPGVNLHYEILVDERAGTYSIFVSNGASVVNVPMEGMTFTGVDRIDFGSGVIASSQVDWVLDQVTFEQL